MRKLTLIGLLLLVPFAALAQNKFAVAQPAQLETGRSAVFSTSSPGNAYAVGGSVVVAAPVEESLTALGGSVEVADPVAGDVSVAGGSASVHASVGGTLRALAGELTVDKPVGGDFAAVAFSVADSARVLGSVFVAAVNAHLEGGANGPVTVYGNTVSLGGDFGGNVRVVAADHLEIEPGTVIHGSLTYQTPLRITLPGTARVLGTTTYTEASYLPSAGISRFIARASIGIFWLMRVLASLVLAGLLAGLFPTFAEIMTREAYETSTRRLVLTTLLGFAAFVATPILIVLLSLTFVGLALAALLTLLYLLLLLLAFVYAGILIGNVASKRLLRRPLRWVDGVCGMLALSVASLIPYIGLAIVLLAMFFTSGALLVVVFRFAFGHPDEEAELVY